MKKTTFTLLSLFVIIVAYGQHTFSIVAVDPDTGEIGSAGATCIAAEDGALAISDIVIGVGAIHTQSFYLESNQANARIRMEAGDSPQEIMDWLVANDIQNDSSARQYLAVDLNNGSPRSAAFTGPDCFEEFIQIIGPTYAIAGNILIGDAVVEDMETAFINTNGTLAEKLMAALQGAKRPGADIRCLNDGISSASAFIRVADPSDTDSSYGNLSLDLNVWITSEIFEPIDELQLLFDEQLSLQDGEKPDGISIYPNPSNGKLNIKSIVQADRLVLLNVGGQEIRSYDLNSNQSFVELDGVANGVYFVLVEDKGKTLTTQKLVVQK